MMGVHKDKLNVQEVKASLRNIVGGEIECFAYSPL